MELRKAKKYELTARRHEDAAAHRVGRQRERERKRGSKMLKKLQNIKYMCT